MGRKITRYSPAAEKNRVAARKFYRNKTKPQRVCTQCGAVVPHGSQKLCNECLIQKWKLSTGRRKATIKQNLEARGVNFNFAKECSLCGEPLENNRHKICTRCVLKKLDSLMDVSGKGAERSQLWHTLRLRNIYAADACRMIAQMHEEGHK